MNTRARRLMYLVIVAVAAVGLAGCGPSGHGRRCPDDPGKSFAGHTVSGHDLRQQKLHCVDLEGATVTGDISDANLSRGDLYNVRLSSTWLRNVDLYDADLRYAAFSSAMLSHVDLRDADLGHAALNKSILSDASLVGARLSGANLSSASLSHSDLTGADLSGANLAGATLSDSTLRGATLRGANVSSVNWDDVVCPDGAPSDRSQSCTGHLDPSHGG